MVSKETKKIKINKNNEKKSSQLGIGITPHKGKLKKKKHE